MEAFELLHEGAVWYGDGTGRLDHGSVDNEHERGR